MGHGPYRGGVAEEVAEEDTEAIGIKGPARGVGRGLYRGRVAEEVAEEVAVEEPQERRKEGGGLTLNLRTTHRGSGINDT